MNVVGTTQLLDALARCEHIPAHLVLSSSRAVYGEGEWESAGDRFYPAPRTHADLEARRWDPSPPSGGSARAIPSVAGATCTEPINVYGVTKLAQEHIREDMGCRLGSSVSILRFQNVYGVGQSLTNPYTGVLSLFAQMALRGETLPSTRTERSSEISSTSRMSSTHCLLPCSPLPAQVGCSMSAVEPPPRSSRSRRRSHPVPEHRNRCHRRFSRRRRAGRLLRYFCDTQEARVRTTLGPRRRPGRTLGLGEQPVDPSGGIVNDERWGVMEAEGIDVEPRVVCRLRNGSRRTLESTLSALRRIDPGIEVVLGSDDTSSMQGLASVRRGVPKGRQRWTAREFR